MVWRRHGGAWEGAATIAVLALAACSPPRAHHAVEAPAAATPTASVRPTSSGGDVETTVPLEEMNGAFVVPGRINDAVDLKFIIDTGSSDVSIPADVAERLIHTGVIGQDDFIGNRVTILADGSRIPAAEFRIRRLQVGDLELQNVTASLSSRPGPVLLGQSFLTRLTSWSIDNQKRELRLKASEESLSGVAAPAVVSTAPTPIAPAMPMFGPSPQADTTAAANGAMARSLEFFAVWSAPYNPNGEAMRRFYAPWVNYYGAAQSADDVMQTTTEFCRRWPIRRYQVRRGSLKAVCASTLTCRVSGLVDWDVTRSDRAARRSGTGQFAFDFRAGAIEGQSGQILTQIASPGGWR